MFLGKGNLDRLPGRPAEVEPFKVKSVFVSRSDGVSDAVMNGLIRKFEKAGVSLLDQPSGDSDAVLVLGTPSLEEIEAVGANSGSAPLLVANSELLKEISAAQIGEHFQPRVAGFNVCDPRFGSCVEIASIEHGTNEKALASAYDLAKQLRLTPVPQNPVEQWFSEAAQYAIQDELGAMLNEGIPRAVVRNAVRFAGFHPAVMRQDVLPAMIANKEADFSFDDLKERLLVRVALVGADFVGRNLLTPEACDLLSVFAVGMPSWAGGAISYIDTIGVREFITKCEALSNSSQTQFKTPDWLQAMEGSEIREQQLA